MERGTLHETLNQTETGNKEGVGPITGIIIVLMVLVSGALYFFFQEVEKTKKNTPSSSAQEILKEKDQITETLKEQSTTDEINSIKKDLDKTSIENLDKGIENIKEKLRI